MTIGRINHSATLISGGKVLVAGGYYYSTGLSSAEVYDPATETWAVVRPMGATRVSHAAALLPSGRVLITGGSLATVSAEIYDPAANTWKPTSPMVSMTQYGVPQYEHTATFIPSGASAAQCGVFGSVLVAGGAYGGTGAELF